MHYYDLMRFLELQRAISAQKKKEKETKNDRCFLLTIARSNDVTTKVLSRLKTNTLVSATVSSGTGQLGIDYLTV